MHEEYKSVKQIYEDLFYDSFDKKYIKSKTDELIRTLMKDIDEETTLLKLPQEDFAKAFIKAIEKEYVYFKPEFKPSEESFNISKYLEDMYDYVAKKKYTKELENCVDLLNINEDDFKKLAVENINLNLYCDICLIYQKLKPNSALMQSRFLEEISGSTTSGDDEESNFRKRLQPESLKSTSSATIKDIDGYTCYIPNLIQAFKDVFFVQVGKKNTQYISEEYSDIFKVLIYDSAGETSIERIKSYRIWEFTEEEIKNLLNVYEEIYTTKEPFHANKIAEFILLEKMFGLATISKLRLNGLKTKQLKNILTAISPINRLGYSSLTEKILESVSTKSLEEYENLINNCIYPLCTDVLVEILSEVIEYINRNGLDASGNVIFKIKTACDRKINTKPCYKQILQLKYTEDSVADNLKTLMGVPTIKDGNTDSIYNYLCEIMNISFNEFNKRKNSIVYDIGFADLTYSLNENFSLSLTDYQILNYIEENKKNISKQQPERIKY